jgi:SAM-dependent methyltransferase
MSESVSDTLSFTGERFLPECNGEIWYEHWHRYALARQLSQHCTVLDVACGEGYGSSMVAHIADKVVGVDISADAVGHARQRYRAQPNLEFVEASCDKLPFPDASFDLAISFETIEHIETQQEFIAELTRVLRPDGVLLLSSPNKRLYSDAHDYHNEFHVRELYRNELEDLLRPAFPHLSWFGQKLLFHSAIWPENQACANTEYLIEQDLQVNAVGNPSVEPMYYIVACSRNAAMLPTTLDKLSLFSDMAETVYQDYAKQTRRVLELDRNLIDRERLIAERDDLLALRTEQMEQRDGLIVERDVLLTARNEQLEQRTLQIEQRERLIAERDALLALRTEQFNLHVAQLSERDAMLAALKQQVEYRAGLNWWLKSPLRFLKQALKAS